jgi:hypothetical protein
MTKETLLTCKIALTAEIFRIKRYADQYPDGGYSQDPIIRVQKALDEVETLIKNL